MGAAFPWSRDPQATERALDPDRLVKSAIRAYKSNRFLTLVGGRQVESLDETIVIAPGTQISFIKLVPLAGG